MIANDTGPLHLAVALGRPGRRAVYLHLSDSTGPYGQMRPRRRDPVWCRGSYLKTCPAWSAWPN